MLRVAWSHDKYYGQNINFHFDLMRADIAIHDKHGVLFTFIKVTIILAVIYYCRPTKLHGSEVFTSFCHSVHRRGVCIPGPRSLLRDWYALSHVPSGGVYITCPRFHPTRVCQQTGSVYARWSGGGYTRGRWVDQREWVCLLNPHRHRTWDTLLSPGSGHHNTYGWQTGSTYPTGMHFQKLLLFFISFM